jgi:hypothetical protein
VGVFLPRRPSSPLPWPFADPTHQPLYFAGRNRFTPDLLRRPIPSQTRPLPLLRLIPPTKRFRPNRDASIRPRQPHAAPSHPLAVGRRLRTEPSHHVAVRRCAVVACRCCTRRNAVAKHQRQVSMQRPLMVPARMRRLGCCLAPPFRCVAWPPAHACVPFLPSGACPSTMWCLSTASPPTWRGQPPRAKVRSFVSCHGRCRRARVALLPST